MHLIKKQALSNSPLLREGFARKKEGERSGLPAKAFDGKWAGGEGGGEVDERSGLPAEACNGMCAGGVGGPARRSLRGTVPPGRRWG
ncbi:MAG: hypothetical protein M3Y60_02550 [Bacteroidota bacterium]|nr:hypothetical protein [Bacteroidota bacterium]